MSAGLEAAVRELVEVLRRTGAGEVVFVRDPEALARLQQRRRLPAVYAEFLRTCSSHDFVDSGLVCAGVPAWLTPVDSVEEIAACFPKLPRDWLVCAIGGDGCYALALERSDGDECPVMFVQGGAREVAPSFVEFLQRIARDTAATHGLRGAAPAARAGVAWAALAVAATIAVGWTFFH